MKHMTFGIKKFYEYAQASRRDFVIDKETGFCGRFRFSDRNHMVIGADLGLNSSAAQRISNDKLFAASFLAADGINVMASVPCSTLGELEAVSLAFPLIVKPNEGSGGEGVYKVDSREELLQAYASLAGTCNYVLVQECISKPEYRILVFKGRVYFAYQRLSYVISGDGDSSVRQIIARRNDRYRKSQQIDMADPRLLFNLKKQGKGIDDVLAAGERLQLFYNANLSAGASLVDVTDDCHDYYRQLAVRCCDALGLKIAGIDLFADSLSVIDDRYQVIEVNGSPGFEYFSGREDLLDSLFADIMAFLEEEYRGAPPAAGGSSV